MRKCRTSYIDKEAREEGKRKITERHEISEKEKQEEMKLKKKEL